MQHRACSLGLAFWLAFGMALAWSPSASAIVFNWVPIANPGNACDTQPSQGCFGAVPDPYSIAKYEVTNAQYAVFLNAVADADPGGLYDTRMSGGFYGGITRTGSSGSFVYAATPARSNWPVVYVGVYDAMRFANWLHNGQPTGPQGTSTTEDGAYSLSDFNPGRNTNAQYFVPNEDEWYKAAYYDPNTSSYYDYPAGTSTPTTCAPPGSGSNIANCGDAGGPGGLTDVGSYTGSPSPYGTSDQGGNVYEWTETIKTGFPPTRVLRGGSWLNFATDMAASWRTDYPANNGEEIIGFRIARPGLIVAGNDIDGDGIPDVLDRCMLDSRNAVANCDTDQDGYGNVCDGDFNQSMVTNAIDQKIISILLPSSPPTSQGTDMDCSGTVDQTDYDDYFMVNFSMGKPGPSGLACAGVPPC